MKRLPFFLLLASLAGFVFAVVHLFQLRFASGDIYPPYSSLRSDPLGVKALFQSLDQLLPTERNFRPLAKLGDGRDTTLFFLGATPEDLEFDFQELRELERFVTTGGRLVISLYPSQQSHEPLAYLSQNSSTNRSPGSRRASSETGTLGRSESLEKRWGFNIGSVPMGRDGAGKHEAVEARLADESATDLSPRLRWHSGSILTNLDPAWRVLYSRPKNAALIAERDFDRGTVVLATDSYLFSNEALQQEAQLSLLTWFVGPARRVVFDETHFGVAANPGVATLLRKYRLHLLFGALLFLAALFVWKNAVSLIPATLPRASEDHPTVVGKEASAGLINLLRRSIPPSGLLALCLDEWKKTGSHGRARGRLAEIQTVMTELNTRPPKERDPVQIYRRISEILARKI